MFGGTAPLLRTCAAARPLPTTDVAEGPVLPTKDPEGNLIQYREWDVNTYQPGVNRGAERLVTGTDGRAYYTADHYRTFLEIQ